jgi:hypothetical protein
LFYETELPGFSAAIFEKPRGVARLIPKKEAKSVCTVYVARETMPRSNIYGTDLGGSNIWSFGPKRNPHRRVLASTGTCGIGKRILVPVQNTFSSGGFRFSKSFYFIFIIILARESSRETTNIIDFYTYAAFYRRTSQRNSSARTQRGFTPKYVLRRMTRRQVIPKWKYYTKGLCTTTCAASMMTMKSKSK